MSSTRKKFLSARRKTAGESVAMKEQTNTKSDQEQRRRRIPINELDAMISESVNSSSSKNTLWSRIRSYMGYCAFCMFASVSMIVGILLVYYNSPGKPDLICQLKFMPVAQSAAYFDSRPRSIAIGDFNNDTKPDIAVVNSNIHTIGIFIGYGDGNFLSQMTYPTGDDSYPYSIVTGDLNNDKKLDLVVGNYGTHNIGVFLGNGNSTFISQMTYSTFASRPLHIALGDFNNDSYLDLAVVNFGTHDISIYLGYENGSFIFQTTYSTAYDSLPSYIVVADLNNDKRLDLIVANSGTDNFGIFFANRDGTFASQKTYSTGSGSRPSSIVIGDFNNDNKLDIAVAKYAAKQIGIFFGFGNELFIEKNTFSTDALSPFRIATDDFNKDNRQDLIIIFDSNEYISVWLGYGNGTFVDEQKYYTGLESDPCFVATGDFNSDNRLDIAVANIISNNIGIFLGDNPVSFRTYESYSTGIDSYPRLAAVGYFNHDNHADVAVVNQANGNIGVFLGYGNGSLTAQTIYPTGEYSQPVSIAIGDFNNDNQSDIVVANTVYNSIGIFLGHGDGTFAEQIVYFAGLVNGINTVTVGDFNNDKRLDIVISKDIDSNNVCVYLGRGNGSFLDEPTYVTNIGFTIGAVAVGDLNNDGRLDIVVVELAVSTTNVLLGYGNGNFKNATTYLSNSGRGQCSVCLIDLNKDTYLDLVIGYSGTGHIGIMLGHDEGVFKDETLYSFNKEIFPSSIVVGDFNNDTRLDLVVIDANNNGMYSLLGYGNGTFTSPMMISSGLNQSYVAMSDFNEDNRQDIVVVNQNSLTITIFLGYDFGAFTNQTTHSTGSASRPVSVTVGDFNYDKRSDIVVANSGTDSVSVLLGNGDGNFTSVMIYSSVLGSQPKSVVVGDFNRDTHFDIVVSNSGRDSIGVFLGYSNATFAREITYSVDSGSRPSSIATGDFNNDNWSDIAVGNYGTNTISVFYGYNYTRLTDQTIYETGYESAPNAIVVVDLNNDNQLDMITPNYRGDSFCIFLGYNHGYFALQATYLTGLDSAPCSIAVGDFNRDNTLDLVVTNTGTHNIMIYLGYGNGSFIKRVTYSTGEDAHSNFVVVGDFNNDDRLDVVVANGYINNVVIFLGQGDGTFGSIRKIDTGFSYNPYAMAIGDFNNDNQLDIIVANYFGMNIGVLLGYGNGSFEDQKQYFSDLGSSPTSVAVGDFNKDNQSDIVVVNQLGTNIYVSLGQSNGSFSDPIRCTSANDLDPTSVTVGDFNNDNELDICVADKGGTIIIYHGNGDGTFGHKITYTTGYGSAPNSVATGYFNNDNQLDIAVANYFTNNIGVFFGNGHNPFPGQTTFSTGSDFHPIAVVTADFNNDTYLDLIIINEDTDNVSILIGNEQGTFPDQMTFSTGIGSHPISVAVAYLDNDLYLDIAIADSGNEAITVFFGCGNGTFKYDRTYWIGYGSRPNSAVTGDFNNDTYVDIAVSNDGTNNIVILSGYGNGSFATLVAFSTGYNSLPRSLTVGDFNSDTIPDVAVAMIGTNNIGIISEIC